MAILDIILLLCFVPAIVSGLSKGLVKQVAELAALLLAAWAAFAFSTPLAGWLGQFITLDPVVLKVIAFVLIAAAASLLLNLVGNILTHALKALSLGLLNHVLGVVFAVLKTALVLGLVILLFESLNETLHLVDAETTKTSVVYRFLRDTAEHIFPIIKTFVASGTDPALSHA
ncbi:MAG: CvpA family protein [Bacteroidales bacterium]|nr:CvpA family protein [Bacteroidales bacterium]